MPDPQLRAADSDREAVAATLGRAMSEGRLAVEEYEERLAKAYAARTYGDLAGLTADLPNSAPPGQAARPRPSRAPLTAGACGPAPWMRGGLRAMWAPWITTALIVTAIWLATALGGGVHYFWPIWVIGPWGAMLLARTLGGGPSHARRPRDRARGRDRW